MSIFNLIFSSKSSWKLSLFFVSILYILYSVISIPMWSYYGGAIAHIVPGLATRNALTDTYIYGFFKFNLFFIWLYKNAPSFPWMGVILQIISLLSYTAIFSYFICISIQNPKAPIKIYNILLIATLIAIMLFPSIVHPSISGQSFLLASASLLWANRLQQLNITLLQKMFCYTFSSLVYCFAFINLIEPALATTGIVGGYLFLFSNQKTKTALWLLPMIFLGSVTMFCITHSLKEVPFLEKTEKALFYVGDGVNDNNLISDLSKKDAMKYKAIRTFFLSDEEELTEAMIIKFYNIKIAKEKKEPFNFSKICIQAWSVAKQTIIDNWYFLPVIGLILTIIIFTFKETRLTFSVYSLVFGFVLFFLAYTLKLSDRHYVYLTQMFVFCGIIHLINSGKELIKSYWSKRVVLTISFTVLLITLTQAFYDRKKILNELDVLKRAEKELNEVTKGKIILMDSYSIALYRGTPYTVRSLDAPSRILFYDFGQLPIIPQYKKFLDSACNCNSRNIIDFYSWLYTNRSDVIIISAFERTDFISDYLKTVHNFKMKFDAIPGNKNITEVKGEGQTLNYFTIAE